MRPTERLLLVMVLLDLLCVQPGFGLTHRKTAHMAFLKTDRHDSPKGHQCRSCIGQSDSLSLLWPSPTAAWLQFLSEDSLNPETLYPEEGSSPFLDGSAKKELSSLLARMRIWLRDLACSCFSLTDQGGDPGLHLQLSGPVPCWAPGLCSLLVERLLIQLP